MYDQICCNGSDRMAVVGAQRIFAEQLFLRLYEVYGLYLRRSPLQYIRRIQFYNLIKNGSSTNSNLRNLLNLCLSDRCRMCTATTWRFTPLVIRQNSFYIRLLGKRLFLIAFIWSKCNITTLYKHCVKSVRIRSYFWYVFSCTQSEQEYGPGITTYLDTFHAEKLMRSRPHSSSLNNNYSLNCSILSGG